MFSRLMAGGRVAVAIPAFLLMSCASGPQSVDQGQPQGQAGQQTQTTGTQSQPVSQAQPAEPPRGYRLDEGDLISIQVFDEPDLTMQQRVGASGVINYSYLGNVAVAGKSPQELESDITSRLSDGYLVNPSVNVSIVEYRPFFINGEVQAPGSYPFQPGLTLDKAIALAGGLTDRASRRKMFVLKAASEKQRQERVSMGSRIHPGDIISIQEGFF